MGFSPHQVPRRGHQNNKHDYSIHHILAVVTSGTEKGASKQQTRLLNTLYSGCGYIRYRERGIKTTNTITQYTIFWLWLHQVPRRGHQNNKHDYSIHHILAVATSGTEKGASKQQTRLLNTPYSGCGYIRYRERGIKTTNTITQYTIFWLWLHQVPRRGHQNNKHDYSIHYILAVVTSGTEKGASKQQTRLLNTPYSGCGYIRYREGGIKTTNTITQYTIFWLWLHQVPRRGHQNNKHDYSIHHILAVVTSGTEKGASKQQTRLLNTPYSGCGYIRYREGGIKTTNTITQYTIFWLWLHQVPRRGHQNNKHDYSIHHILAVVTSGTEKGASKQQTRLLNTPYSGCGYIRYREGGIKTTNTITQYTIFWLWLHQVPRRGHQNNKHDYSIHYILAVVTSGTEKGASKQQTRLLNTPYSGCGYIRYREGGIKTTNTITQYTIFWLWLHQVPRRGHQNNKHDYSIHYILAVVTSGTEKGASKQQTRLLNTPYSGYGYIRYREGGIKTTNTITQYTIFWLWLHQVPRKGHQNNKHDYSIHHILAVATSGIEKGASKQQTRLLNTPYSGCGYIRYREGGIKTTNTITQYTIFWLWLHQVPRKGHQNNKHDYSIHHILAVVTSGTEKGASKQQTRLLNTLYSGCGYIRYRERGIKTTNTITQYTIFWLWLHQVSRRGHQNNKHDYSIHHILAVATSGTEKGASKRQTRLLNTPYSGCGYNLVLKGQSRRYFRYSFVTKLSILYRRTLLILTCFQTTEEATSKEF